MTSRDLSKLMDASATSVNTRLHISAEYLSLLPTKVRSGCLIQCELSPEDQEATGKRYHCLSLSEEEIQLAIRAMNKAARHSLLIRRKVESDRRSAALSAPSTDATRGPKLQEANSLTSPKLSRRRELKGQPWRAA